MKKILVILFNIERAREHEWFVKFIDRNRFKIEFALINKPGSYLEQFLGEHQVKVYNFRYRGKKDLLPLTFDLFRLMRREKYHIVHAHLFEATLAGMTAARFAGVPGRIITRHNSDFHHVYFPSAVKYDRYAARLSNHVIAVSENVKNILIEKEKVPASKITLIHHGIDFAEFDRHLIGEEKIRGMRAKYRLDAGKAVIGVVSRFIEWKGLQYIIPAFRMIQAEFPEAILVLANAQGPYLSEVKSLLKQLDETSYRLVDFETDIAALFHTFTCFVHTPVSPTAEAFGQTYIEAMAARIPSVITLSGVACEFAKDKINCLEVPYRDSKSIFTAVVKILKGEVDSKAMTEEAYKTVVNNFGVKKKYEVLNELYSQIV